MSSAGRRRSVDTIDREVKSGWTKEKLTSPERAADHIFLRRIYLDLVGMIPSYEEATAFFKDSDPKKREKLVDRLLAEQRWLYVYIRIRSSQPE